MQLHQDEVPREEWPAFCRSFSRRHHAWLVEVREPLAQASSSRIARHAPWERVELTARPTPHSSLVETDANEEIRVSLAATDEQDATVLAIQRPHRIAVLRTDDGAHAGLRIETPDGQVVRAAFPVRRPARDTRRVRLKQNARSGARVCRGAVLRDRCWRAAARPSRATPYAPRRRCPDRRRG